MIIVHVLQVDTILLNRINRFVLSRIRCLDMSKSNICFNLIFLIED